MLERVETVVIGSGVVGLAIARKLGREGREVIVLEAENAIGTSTSSRNSEVIHAGIYYPSRSLKSRLCVEGRISLYQYCIDRGIAHRKTSKLILATSLDQIGILQGYMSQARSNGVHDLLWLTAQQVRELEPDARCVAALLSPSTGIIDSHALMLSFQADVESNGGVLALKSPVVGGVLTDDGIVLRVGGAAPVELLCDLVVNAAGLGAQEVSHTIAGLDRRMIPPRYLAKGSYFSFSGRSPFNRLIYPIATSASLGIHLTLDLDGRARFGPDVEWIDHLNYDVDRNRASTFADAIRAYYPELDETKLQPAYAGIRPKITAPGEPAGDFCIRACSQRRSTGYIALYGIESPGLTASLAIAEYVATLCHAGSVQMQT